MAERFAPIRTVRPASAPVSLYYDVSPLAQLLRTEETQGMQVARALSGLAPTLMNISQTMAQSEMQEGQEAVARIPEEFKGDMEKINKWFDEQGLPGPFRSIAFREGVGKRVYGQRLARSLEGIRDSYSRVIDENGAPVTQAQRAKILQGALDSVGVPDDPLVQRGYLSVKENITSSFLTQSDSAIAANLKRANDNQASEEVLDRIIAFIDGGDIEATGEAVQTMSDMLKRSGLSASGREALYKAAADYISLVTSNPNAADGELERARALVSEMMSPEDYGRPPLPPDMKVAFEALEDRVDLALDDNNVNRINRITAQYRGPVYEALAQVGAQLTQSEFINLVEQATGLSRLDSSQVASRLTSLLEAHNRGMEENGIPMDEFSDIRKLAESGDMTRYQLDYYLTRSSPTQRSLLSNAYNSSPFSVPGVQTRSETVSQAGTAALLSGAPVPFDQTASQALRGELEDEFGRAFGVSMDEIKRSEDWLNGSPDQRFEMAATALDQAMQTATEVVTSGETYTRNVRQAEARLEGGFVGALRDNAINKLSLDETYKQNYANLPTEDQREYFAEHEKTMREVVSQWLSEYRSQNPEATVKDIDTAFNQEQNDLVERVWNILDSPIITGEGEIKAPPAGTVRGLGIAKLKILDILAGGTYANEGIGDGWFWNTPLFNAQSAFTSSYKRWKKADDEGKATEKLRNEFEASRDEYERMNIAYIGRLIRLDSDPQERATIGGETAARLRREKGKLFIAPGGVFVPSDVRQYATRFTGGYRKDEDATKQYLNAKSFGNWEFSELEPVGTDDRGDTYWETAEGMRFYSMASGRENRVDPVTNLFFKNNEELEASFREFTENGTGPFKNVMDILGPNRDLSPFDIYTAQRQMILVRRRIPTNE